ncbi:MAG: Ceramide glucosyltransferase, partial [Hyphomicrobiales bacterium]|nr:Ceramide glucosyltransferase [Hyphomicrobiales bacterium]
MSLTLIICSILAGVSLAVHLASHLLAFAHLRRREPHGVETPLPSVSLVRPLCGLEPFTSETLEASFRLAHPDHELIFCVMDPRDSVVALVNDALARHPQVRARLLVGGAARSGNPKLDNMEKGYRAATGDVVIFADSNLLVAQDYLTRVLGTFDEDAGLVSAPPVGSSPSGLWAEIECALLNTYAARWQYAVAALGFGFAQGKTLAFRRRDLDAGAFDAMAREAAEDAAATKFVRASGRAVRLVAPPFPQPIGRRTAAAVWSRHLRWARLRRATFPLLFAPEILTSGLVPGAAAVVVGQAAGLPPVAAALGFALVWYGAEARLAKAAGWPLSWGAPLAFLGRDVLLLALWVGAWTGRSFVWRGHAMSATGL